MNKSIFTSGLAYLAFVIACGAGTPPAQEPLASGTSQVGGRPDDTRGPVVHAQRNVS